MAFEFFGNRLKSLPGSPRKYLPLFIGIAWTVLYMCPAAAQVEQTSYPFQYPGQKYVEYPGIIGKVQHFELSGVPRWATFAMENRERTEGMTALNYISGNGQIYDETRLWGSLEVRPTSFLTLYGQFHDDHALGLPLQYVASNMRDAFDLRQGYLRFHFKPAELFVGRKELRFGQERLLGISPFTNTSRTFDGFFGRIGDKNRLDLFSTSVVVVHPTSLDTHGAGLNFHGAYATLSKLVPGTSFQPYVVIKRLPRVTSHQGIVGTQNTVTTGAEVIGGLPKGFDYDLFANFQRGSYSNDSIHAGAAYVKVSYIAPRLPWSPRLGGEYDYATGDKHQNLQQWGTYDQSYPSNHNAFGLLDLFGFQNIRQTRINLDLEPLKHLDVLIQQEFLNLASVQDGAYNGSGTEFMKPPTGGFRSDALGKGFDASGKYQIHDFWVVGAGVGHFFPGEAMVEGAHGPAQTFAYLSLTYRFQLDHKKPNQ